eukprot:scaffold119471_cov72-Phaeocystis_antarctica.AAC.3
MESSRPPPPSLASLSAASMTSCDGRSAMLEIWCSGVGVGARLALTTPQTCRGGPILGLVATIHSSGYVRHTTAGASLPPSPEAAASCAAPVGSVTKVYACSNSSAHLARVRGEVERR